MSTATVKAVIQRFLKSDAPEVLVLKGSWGVGKTYAWTKWVTELRDEVKPANYCYVSLFGMSSIQDLRLAIFAKTSPARLLGEKRDFAAINKEWLTLAWSGAKNLVPLVKKVRDAIPHGNQVSVGLELLTPHLIGSTLICLDDFERLGEQVRVDDLLGFISALKEEKQCKVVLIFNEERLEKKEADYKKYREKLVDIELLFAPTAEEAADLALRAGPRWYAEARRRAVSLGIKNIRLLRKIARIADLVDAAVGDLHQNVIAEAVSTVVLLCWSYYEPDAKKPSLEFIRTYNLAANAIRGLGRPDEQPVQPQQEGWEKVLDDYGFQYWSEFDTALLKVVDHGYIEESGVVEEARKLDAQIRAGELEASFSSAWRMFHDSFGDNRGELVAALRESTERALEQVSPLNLDSTVKLLRGLDEDRIADGLIENYIERRRNEPKLFDLEEYAFGGGITDPTLRARFEEKHRAANPVPSLKEAVMNAVENKGFFDDAGYRALDGATEEDFYRLFKDQYPEKHLHRVVKACVSADGSPGHEEAGRRAKAALDRIARESDLNRLRVQNHLRRG